MSELNLSLQYTDFINNLVGQVTSVLPEDISNLQLEYLEKSMKNSLSTCTQGLLDVEEFASLKFDKQTFFMQAFAEWTFHKEIDLFRSGIPPKYWRVIMQKIWYVIFEVMCACIKNDASESITLSILERYINRAYNDAIDELKSFAVIDSSVEEQAKSQSNIKEMADELASEQSKKTGFNSLKHNVVSILRKIFWSLVIIDLVAKIIYHFGKVGMIVILSALVIYNLILMKKD
jgi:hypothetical protein